MSVVQFAGEGEAMRWTDPQEEERAPTEDESGYEAILALMKAIREDRIKRGLTVDTVEWLTEIYEARGYSHEDAVKLARGEELPEEPEPPP